MIVRQAVEKKGWNTDSFNGEGWWLRFMERHPGLSWSVLTSQSKRTDRRENEGLFDLLEKALTDHGLLNRAPCIYNMEWKWNVTWHETAEMSSQKRGWRRFMANRLETLSQITLVACGNAAGTVLPPVLIFKEERLNHKWWMMKSWIHCTGCLRMAGSRTFLLLVEGFVFEAYPSSVPCHARNGWPLLLLHAQGPTWCSSRGVYCFLHPAQHNPRHSTPWCESFWCP